MYNVKIIYRAARLTQIQYNTITYKERRTLWMLQNGNLCNLIFCAIHILSNNALHYKCKQCCYHIILIKKSDLIYIYVS